MRTPNATLAVTLILAAGVAAAACNKKSSAPEGAVASAAPSEPGSPPRVSVTADGFQPSRLTLDASRRVVFRRTTDQTCATSVVFPELKIEKPLPLDTDVVVELPPSAKGEYGFQCGMGMYQSKLVVN